MKKILFVSETMEMNGANKSLINLLNVLDTTRYDVDLLLFCPSGKLTKLIPDYVNVLPKDDTLYFYKCPLKQAIINAPLRIKLMRILAALIRIVSRTTSENLRSKIILRADTLDNDYDAAIAYCEGNSHLYILEKVESPKKIGWIHTNIEKLAKATKRKQIKYCQELDFSIVVSDDSKKTLHKLGVPYKKVKLVPNIISPRVIYALSQSPHEKFHSINECTILTIGRLSVEKGIDIIIETVNYLISNFHKSFTWVILGDGDQQKYQKEINQRGLEKNILLHESVINPYPYIKLCDIYVQPSRFEGLCMATNEAKILHKPIVVSDFPSFYEQIFDGINGSIRPLNAKAIGDAIIELATNATLREKYITNLSMENLGNEAMVEILYDLLK